MKCKPLAALCLLAVATAASGGDVPDVTLQGVASGSSLKIGFEGHGARVLPETVYLRGNRMRMEFQAIKQQGYLLRDGNAVWLVNDKAKLAWPLPYRGNERQFIFDAAAPCRELGFRCERDGAKSIAGRPVTGWRFRHAGTRGPDGSDSGTLWIDDQYGLLLGYHGEDMNSRSMNWTVTTVSFEALPKELFQLPDGTDPAGKPGSPPANSSTQGR